MEHTRFDIGSEVFCGNSRYRVVGVVDMEHVMARSSFTGNVRKFHVSELSSSPSDKDNPVDVIPAKDLLLVPDEAWVKANNKALLFNQVLQVEDEYDRRLKLQEVAKELGISEPTAYRQLQKYKASEGNPLSLLRKKREDKGRFPDEIEKLIQKQIDFYLSTIRPKVSDLYRTLKLDVQRLNKERKKEGLKPYTIPHANTLRTRINNLSASQVATKRKGKKGREAHRPIIGKFPEPEKPLAVVQIDHTPLDLILVDDEYRLEIGRPTVTLAIDVYSRMVAGFYISFEKPNMLVTGACITHSVLDKKGWLDEHGIEGEWPVCGLMDTIHTDNGMEFHSKALKRACEIYHINMTKRPAGTPRYGGHIERLFKTLNDGGIHTLPGTTKSNVTDKGEYQSGQKAAMTLFEFETWFTDFIVNVYHREVHSELGMTPLEKYKKGILGDGETLGRGLPPRVENPLKLKIDFLPYEERTVQKYGIQIFGMYYFHDILRKWIKQPDRYRKETQKFTVRYDPRDLSSVFFYDPDMESYVVVPYRDTSHPPVSLWQLKMLKRKLKDERPNDDVNEDVIFEAHERMKRLTEEANRRTKHVRRMQQKEKIRDKESLPSQAKKVTQDQGKNTLNVLNPSVSDYGDDEFDDIQPYEDIDQ